MKRPYQVMALIFCICVNVAIAFESEVVVKIGDINITNVDVYEKKGRADSYLGPGGMESILERLIEPHLFEQYIQRNNVQVTDQQVIDDLTRLARSGSDRDTSAEEFFQKDKDKDDKVIQDWNRFKSSKKAMLKRQAIVHFAPGALNVTDEDIQEYIDYNKRRGRMMRPFGNFERVQIRSLTAESEVLDEIKKRTNSGEKFEDVIGEYVDRDELNCEPQAHWFNTSNFEKKGLDALVPWSKLKGKIVSTTARGTSHVWVMMIDDYTPNTRITFEDGFKSGKEQYLKLVIERVRGGKYVYAKARFLKEQKAKMPVFMDSEKNIYQKLADGYGNWWKETFKDAPDFQKRLKDYQDSKTRWLQRQERKKNK